MSQITLHDSHARATVNRRNPRSPRADFVAGEPKKGPEEIKAMLREIAFVLKMTRRIHDEIENRQESDDLVHA